MKQLFKNQKGTTDVVLVIIIVSFIGAIFITGTYLWQEVRLYKNFPVKQTQVQPKKEYYDLISQYCQGASCRSMCRPNNCLFINSPENPNQPFGLATLEGWFKVETKTDKGNLEVQCDSLVLTGGTPQLINFYIDRYELNNPLINININELDKETQGKIINSTENAPIELTVFKYPPVGKGDSPCLSTIKILEVK